MLRIYALIILLILSAFFSMSETALVSLNRIKLRSLYDRKVKGSASVKKLKDNPSVLLSTILIGNNSVNVASAAIATSLAFEVFPNHAIAASTGIMTLLVLIFGEIIPKSLATQHNIQISLYVAKPILFLSQILKPVIKVLDIITGIFVKPGNKPSLTEEDLHSAVKLGEEEGFIKDIEKDLLKNIFKFDEINVSEIMTPRTDVFSLELNTSLKKALPGIIKTNYSRIPIYEGNLNKIVGIVNIKDVLKELKNGKLDSPIKKIMYKPFFVPENKKVDSMLKQFMKRKEHMAIVVDEHGLVTGLLTLENVIEEIVGEIQDESDKIKPHIIKVSKKVWDVLGKSDIEEVNEKLKANFKEADDYDTISGMVLNQLGRIPDKGDKVYFGEFSVEIIDVEANRIMKVRVSRK
ncbi:MAG: hemolysin family protein [Nanoarchaeota archaeon]